MREGRESQGGRGRRGRGESEGKEGGNGKLESGEGNVTERGDGEWKRERDHKGLDMPLNKT